MLSLENNFNKSKSLFKGLETFIRVWNGGVVVNCSHWCLKINYFQSYRLEECMAYIYTYIYTCIFVYTHMIWGDLICKKMEECNATCSASFKIFIPGCPLLFLMIYLLYVCVWALLPWL